MTFEKAKEIIKFYESLQLSAYRCPVGVPTIGWGHIDNVRMGDVITLEQAELYLSEDMMNKAIKPVQKMVQVPLSENQFNALVSFTFNEGSGNLKSSTLLRKLNLGDYEGAAAEFPRWNKARVDGELVVLDGLTKRRKTEMNLFLQA